MERLRRKLAQHGIDGSTVTPFLELDDGNIHRLVAPAEEAFRLWAQLRELVPRTGLWPVVVGDEQSVRLMVNQVTSDDFPPAAQLIEDGLAIDTGLWFTAMEEENPDFFERDLSGWQEPGPLRPTFESLMASEEGERRDLSVALIPSPVSWHAPGHLRIGGWDTCPIAEVHVALLKRWHERYGADAMAISYDTIELHVARPPKDRAECEALAWEHYVYCPPLVLQTEGGLGGLAASLLGSRRWLFSWD